MTVQIFPAPAPRVYGCANCGRGTLPAGAAARHGIKLNTGLRKVPCTLTHPEGQSCTGMMYVHTDERVCKLVQRHLS